MKPAYVYWIYLDGMTDITKEGYVGFTSKSVETRFKQHLWSTTYKDRTYKFVQVLRKYGKELKVKTLVIGNVDYCLKVEQMLRPNINIGWNTVIGGDCGHIGIKPSEETRRKQSLAATGRKMSEESKKKISDFNKGSTFTLEERQKMSSAKKGKIFTESHKAALSASHKGKPLPEETKNKLKKIRQESPWMSSSRRETWLLVPTLYEMFLNGLRVCDMCKVLDIKKFTIRCIVLKFKNGWNPTTDALFQEWIKK